MVLQEQEKTYNAINRALEIIDFKKYKDLIGNEGEREKSN